MSKLCFEQYFTVLNVGFWQRRSTLHARATRGAPARTRLQPRGAASSLLSPTLPLHFPRDKAGISGFSSPKRQNPTAAPSILPPSSPRFLPVRAAEAHEIPTMAGPTSRLLLLARRSDRCRSLPLLPRAVHAAAGTGAPSPTAAAPPRLPASAPVRRYRLALPSPHPHRIPGSQFRFQA
jgi:hypothetical protein